MRYFVAVAEEGSFSRAARRLHISQPPLSSQLKALEEDLGVRLFDRTNRGVSLTAAGTAFYQEARDVLARLDQARRKALHAGDADIGRLAVGFVSIADYGVLPPALKQFRARFPRIEVQLHELTTDAQIRELRAARLDLSIGLAPVDEPDLAFERLSREELVLAVPTAHASAHLRAKGEGAVDLRTLARESFIIPPRDVAPGLHDLIISHCRAAGFTPQITQHARQMQTVVGLVSCGMGVALVPSSVRNLKRPGVQYRSLRGKRAFVELGILSSRGGHSAQAEHFARSLRAAAKSVDHRGDGA